MADTTVYKTHVEPYVRRELERVHGVAFESRVLRLTSGGLHEFDAVSMDDAIVAGIKSLSGKTGGGNRPAAKYDACVAELYWLSLIDAPRRILVLTTPDWHTMFLRYIEGRLLPGLEVELLRLPPDMQAMVDAVRDVARGEVSPL